MIQPRIRITHSIPKEDKIGIKLVLVIDVVALANNYIGFGWVRSHWQEVLVLLY